MLHSFKTGIITIPIVSSKNKRSRSELQSSKQTAAH